MTQIEAPQQFHEPLMHQRVRHENQYPLRAVRQDQPMQNQAGLDGFAQADFIGEQEADAILRDGAAQGWIPAGRPAAADA